MMNLKIKHLLALLLLLFGVTNGMAESKQFLAKLTAKTSATGKGLVYAAKDNTAPKDDTQYRSTIAVTNSGQNNSHDVPFFAWAKPLRGYLFDGWTADGATINGTTGNGDAVTITSSSQDDDNPTLGTITANWKETASYTVTYKKPVNKGEYTVKYEYPAVVNNTFGMGGETYTMSTDVAEKAVKSYPTDKVTLSTTLSTFLGWYDGETLLSKDKTFAYNITKNATVSARFEAPKEFPVSVTSNGSTTQYRTIQEAFTAAALMSAPTITLLDNITGVDELLTISSSMTLDLNGYTLSGKGGRSSQSSASDLSSGLLLVDGDGIVVTIKDGSATAAGTINCSAAVNNVLYAIRVDNGTLNIESGNIRTENTLTSGNANSKHTYIIYIPATATAGITSVAVSGGKFIASGTGAAFVNRDASLQSLTITGGFFQQKDDIEEFVPSTKTIYDVASSSADYTAGYRYYVSDWDTTKPIAKNTTTGKTYTSIKSALDEAVSGQTVVVTANCRFDEQATVKNGVTLLVPYDDDYTLSTTKAVVTQNWSALTPYVTVVMGSDASINVQNGGAISIGGKQFSTSNQMSATYGGPGSPTGPYGCIDMSHGGKITLQNGANLYVWGFITGQNMYEGNNTTGVGSIEALDGSAVYEDFVIADWHGGNVTSNMDQKKKYFPFNQYFIPNIEVPLTVNYGATLNTISDISAGTGIKKPYSVPVTFISKTGALFNMSSAQSSAKLWYDATTDEQHFEFTGDNNIKGVTISVDGITVDASYYVMPLTSNFSIRVKNGSISLPSDVALLPGSEISLDEGSTASIEKGANVYVYDLADWGPYSYGSNRKVLWFRPTKFKRYEQGDNQTNPDAVASRTGLKDARLEVNGKLNVAGNLFTTSAGGNICSNRYGQITFSAKPVASTTTYQVSGLQNEVAIPATAPQLRNAEGYSATANATAGSTYYYNPGDGSWTTTVVAPASFAYADNRLVLNNATGISADIVKEAIVNNNAASLLSADLSKATNKSFDVSAMRTAIGANDNNNILLYAPSNSSAADNVIVNGTAAKFVVADQQPVKVPDAFTASSATYSRKNTNADGEVQFGTICLPFAVKSDDGIQFYQLEGIDGNTMNFKRVDEVAANTPALFSVSSSESDIIIEVANAAVPVTAEHPVATTVNGTEFTLRGAQSASQSLPAGSTTHYYICSNSFVPSAGNTVAVSPQRAYFQLSASSSVQSYAISVDDGTATGISAIDGSASVSAPTIVAIYSVNGARLDTLRPGINIVKMSDGSTKKIVVR